MKKQVKNTGGVINLAEFDKLESEDNTKLENLILKVRESKFISNLPDWIANYPVPIGTRPCAWPVPRCMVQILKIQKEKAINIHPVHQLDMSVSNNDVVLNVKGISYQDEGKVVSLGVSNGYLVPNLKDSVRLMNASTSEIAAVDAKYDKKGNLNPPEWPANFKVPVAECNNVRVVLNNTTSSRSVARDEMFAALSNPSNTIASIRLHSAIGKDLGNFTEVPKLTEAMKGYYQSQKMKIPADLVGRAIGVDSGPLPFTDNISTAYKLYFKSTSIRGGRDGNGLSHGFERFCMSRTMSNTLNLLQDFLNMSREYDSKTVLARDSSYLSTEEIRVLVHNGFRVLLPTQNYGKCLNDSPAGTYSAYDPKVSFFEFIRINEENVRPQYSSGLIQLGTLYDDAVAKIANKKRCFSYVYIDSRLKKYEKTCQLLPSCTADTMQVIFATGSKKTYGLEVLTKRATMAISCRNRFVHCRKAFHTMDIVKDFVRWDQKLYYPRLRAAEEVKFLDLNEFTQGDLTLTVVPMAICDKHFENTVEQAMAATVTVPGLVEEMIARDVEYLCMVYLGRHESNVFTWTTDMGEGWSAKYDPILEMAEHEFLRILSRNDKKEVYDSLYDKFYGQEESDEEYGKELEDEAPPEIKFDMNMFQDIDLNDR